MVLNIAELEPLQCFGGILVDADPFEVAFAELKLSICKSSLRRFPIPLGSFHKVFLHTLSVMVAVSQAMLSADAASQGCSLQDLKFEDVTLSVSISHESDPEENCGQTHQHYTWRILFSLVSRKETSCVGSDTRSG